MSRGDEQRFRELYDRMYNRVWAFVLRRLPDDDAAADVVSETFLIVWRRIREVPRDPRSAEAWVFGTARRIAANSRRSTKRRGRLFDRINQRPVDVFVDLSATDESNVPVMQALDRIRPADREILALSFWEELDTDQIAVVLGCSKNAAAIRLTRARHALRTAMEAIAGDNEPDDDRPGDGEGGER